MNRYHNSFSALNLALTVYMNPIKKRTNIMSNLKNAVQHKGCKVTIFNRGFLPDLKFRLINLIRFLAPEFKIRISLLYEANKEMHQSYEQPKWSIPVDSKAVNFNALQ